MVVGADEDDRNAVGGGEDHGLVDVALARRAVAEVRHGHLVATVALYAHRVAHGVEALGADDDLRVGDMDIERVPARVLSAMPDEDEILGLHAADDFDADLAVARKEEIVIVTRPRSADLDGLLPCAGAQSPRCPWRCRATPSASSRRARNMSR